MKKIVCLYGPAAAGKTTQAKLLAASHNFSIFAMGETLREEIDSGSELGLSIKEFIDQGSLISNELMAQIIIRAKDKAQDKDLLFDGFPRTVDQAKMLDQIVIDNKWQIVVFFYLQVSPEIALKRLQERVRQNQETRTDDLDENAVRNRFAIFDQESGPLLDFYQKRGLLEVIDGELSITEIHNLIVSTLN